MDRPTTYPMDQPAGFRDAQGRHGGVVLPARPEPIALDPATTFLIVVDVQNAYASPGEIGRAHV